MIAPEGLLPIQVSIEVEAAIERVWHTMTSELTVPRWLGCLGYEPRVGAIFYMQQDQAKVATGDLSGATHCEILELDAPMQFRFSWFVPGFPATFINLCLESQSPARTRVIFEHQGWDQFPPDTICAIYDALATGWKSYVLPGLKRETETGQ